MSNIVNVADYGTTTAQVQAAATAAAGKRLVFPPSTVYTITSDILIPGNTYVEGNGSTLKTPNSSTTSSTQSDSLLKVNGSGVVVDNLVFNGNLANQGATWSQHRHAVRVHGTHSDVYVLDCSFSGLIGDGVYINVGPTGKNINVLNSTFSGTYGNRNGVSIISGKRITVAKCSFTNLTRSDMPAPVDIEPNSSSDVLTDVLIADNFFNQGTTAGSGTEAAIMVAGFNNAAMDNITIRGNEVRGTRLTSPILAIGINGGPFNAASDIIIERNNVHSVGSSGKVGIDLSYWIGADVVYNTLNGMQYGIYNYKACLGRSNGNTFTGVTTNITNDDPHCS